MITSICWSVAVTAFGGLAVLESALTAAARASNPNTPSRHLEKYFVVANLCGQRLAVARFPKPALIMHAQPDARPAPQFQETNDPFVALHEMFEAMFGRVTGFAEGIQSPAGGHVMGRQVWLTSLLRRACDKTICPTQPKGDGLAPFARPDFHQPTAGARPAEHPPLAARDTVKKLRRVRVARVGAQHLADVGTADAARVTCRALDPLANHFFIQSSSGRQRVMNGQSHNRVVVFRHNLRDGVGH